MVYRPVNSIEVLCWGTPVGVLALDERYGVYAFEYYDSFTRLGRELSPLLVPTSTRGAVVFPNLSRETYYGLPAFIADSLPDAFGNMLIESWMAAKGIARERITPLDRLAYLGKRGMGALEFRPALRRETVKPSALVMANLVETARQALNVNLRRDEQDPVISLGSVKRDAPHDDELKQLIAIGTSAGGARAKALVGYSEKTGSFVSGQLALPAGYDPWIIKFDLSTPQATDQKHESKPYGRIEYAYALMAHDCGIAMQECRLFEAAGRAHFMTRRFDRTSTGEKLHMQTLCALAALDFNVRDTHDYNQAFLVLEQLGLGYDALDELFRRMVYNIALANNDDHTKNIGFLLPQGGGWHLAPAYDLTHAFNPQGIWTRRHLMGVNGKYAAIERGDVLALARRYHVSAPEAALDAVLSVAANWKRYAQEAGVSEESSKRIARDIESCSALLR